MKVAKCASCQRITGFKRVTTLLTLIGIILTSGIWIIAILGYPLRCVICGGDDILKLKIEKEK